MESKATAKFVRVAPRKTRLVARNVKGMPVEAAMNLLRFMPRAQGRATNIHKRTSHITVILAEGQE